MPQNPPQQPASTLPPIGGDVTSMMPDIGQDVTALMGGTDAQAPSAPPTAAAAPPSVFERGKAMLPPQVATGADIGMGIVKGLAKTAIGGAELVNRGASALGLTERIKPEVFNQARLTFATPSNAAQKVGQFGEQTAEFFAPASALTKAKTAVQTGKKALDWILAAGLEAGAAGSVGAVQSGSPAVGVGTGALSAAASAAQPALGKGLTFLGERIEKSLVKATKRDIENGFQVGNIYKHQLGGSLSTTYDKSGEKLKSLSDQLRTQLRLPAPGSAGAVPQVDVQRILQETVAEFASNPTKYAGRNADIKRAIDKLIDDPAFSQAQIDLADANQLKQAMGELGAWQYGMRDPDSTAMEMVANVVYSKLKNSIEQNATNSGKIRALNKAMGEIIPIRQAIIRRIPVEQRSNVLNMGDLIGFGTGSLGLALANRLLRSGNVANVAHTAGEAVAQVPSAAKTGLVGASSQVVR